MNRMMGTIILGIALLELAVVQAATNTPALQAIPAPVIIEAPAVSNPVAPPALVWDAESKDYDAKPGDAVAPFVFYFTNVSTHEVVISNLNTSCGCTAAQLPVQPWHLPPGTNGEIKVTMNLAGKMGRVTKQVNVNSSEGSKALLVNVNMPAPQPTTVKENIRGDRNANMELAKADRQAVFKGDCRSCHIDQGVGKLGKELYAADCGVCHDSHIRAAMVPDLRAPKTARDRNYWLNWITFGRPGSMMPAFGEKDGGPLSKEQIDSLVDYLAKEFPQSPVAVPLPVVAPVPQAVNPKSGAGQ
jgi:cytochrome c5